MYSLITHLITSALTHLLPLVSEHDNQSEQSQLFSPEALFKCVTWTNFTAVSKVKKKKKGYANNWTKNVYFTFTFTLHYTQNQILKTNWMKTYWKYTAKKRNINVSLLRKYCFMFILTPIIHILSADEWNTQYLFWLIKYWPTLFLSTALQSENICCYRSDCTDIDFSNTIRSVLKIWLHQPL